MLFRSEKESVPKKKPLNQQLLEEYEQKGLPKLDGTKFENDLEKEIFVAINLIRNDPKRMAKLINKQLESVLLLTKEGKKSIGDVQKFLEKADSLPPLADYYPLTEVCLNANKEVFSQDEIANEPARLSEEEEDKKDSKPDSKKKKIDYSPEGQAKLKELK